jgi:carbohydrate-selective porin OprB
MSLHLSDATVEFIESGVSMLVATRDGELRGECVRGLGAQVSADRSRVTVFLNEALSARTRANLEHNGQIAIAFSRPIDHHSLQIKGVAIAWRKSSAADRKVQERYLAGFVEQLYWVGLPRAVTRRVRLTPALTVTVTPHSLFLQTPGPDAGRALDPRP